MVPDVMSEALMVIKLEMEEDKAQETGTEAADC